MLALRQPDTGLASIHALRRVSVAVSVSVLGGVKLLFEVSLLLSFHLNQRALPKFFAEKKPGKGCTAWTGASS